jgi:hypothetical protein
MLRLRWAQCVGWNEFRAVSAFAQVFLAGTVQSLFQPVASHFDASHDRIFVLENRSRDSTETK